MIDLAVRLSVFPVVITKDVDQQILYNFPVYLNIANCTGTFFKSYLPITNRLSSNLLSFINDGLLRMICNSTK